MISIAFGALFLPPTGGPESYLSVPIRVHPCPASELKWLFIHPVFRSAFFTTDNPPKATHYFINFIAEIHIDTWAN